MMGNILTILILIFLLGFFVGLIKPSFYSLFGQFSNPSRRDISLFFIIAIITALLILGTIDSDTSQVDGEAAKKSSDYKSFFIDSKLAPIKECPKSFCNTRYRLQRGTYFLWEKDKYSSKKDMPTWVPVSHKTPTGVVEGYTHRKHFVTKKPKLYKWYFENNTNLRECPSKDCKIEETAPRGMLVEIALENKEDLPNWVRIGVNDTFYFAHSSLLSREAPEEEPSNTERATAREASKNKASPPQYQDGRAKEDASRSYTLQEVVQQWRARVGQVGCEFRFKNGDLYKRSLGSGVIASSGIYVLTNKHLVTDKDGYLASRCGIRLPNNDKVYYNPGETEGFRPMGEMDAAVFRIANRDEYLNALVSSKSFDTCKERASIGSEVAVLGYPRIGASEEITITEGVISSYEGGYYLTDAKIDEGNSGGAAILIDKSCFLGIPTKTSIGTAESLGRILDIKAVLNSLPER